MASSAAARVQLADAGALALALGSQSLVAAVMLALAELFDAQGEPAAARRVLAFAADEPSLTVPDRDELRAAWARRASPSTADPPWPGLGMDELLHRIASEQGVAHAPLLAALRTPR